MLKTNNIYQFHLQLISIWGITFLDRLEEPFIRSWEMKNPLHHMRCMYAILVKNAGDLDPRSIWRISTFHANRSSRSYNFPIVYGGTRHFQDNLNSNLIHLILLSYWFGRWSANLVGQPLFHHTENSSPSLQSTFINQRSILVST